MRVYTDGIFWYPSVPQHADRQRWQWQTETDKKQRSQNQHIYIIHIDVVCYTSTHHWSYRRDIRILSTHHAKNIYRIHIYISIQWVWIIFFTLCDNQFSLFSSLRSSLRLSTLKKERLDILVVFNESKDPLPTTFLVLTSTKTRIGDSTRSNRSVIGYVIRYMLFFNTTILSIGDRRSVGDDVRFFANQPYSCFYRAYKQLAHWRCSGSCMRCRTLRDEN